MSDTELSSLPRNCWYVAAWDHEVPAGRMLARRILGVPLLLYRRADGQVVALEDRCPHRQAPLSCGRLEGDHVRCGYHGLRFGSDGRCLEVPGMPEPPSRAGVDVRAFPVVCHHRWLFVWMGDAALADPALLPDNQACDSPDWTYLPGYLHYDAPHRLICDNLLDFSHLSWVHEATLGGSTEIALSRPQVQDTPRGVRVIRDVADVPAPPYYAGIHRFDGPIQRWFDYDFVLPGILLMRSGGHPRGVDRMDPAAAVQLHSCQALTPETDTTTHYFYMQAHPARVPDPDLRHRILASLQAAFEEDRRMICAQAASLDPERPMVHLHFDAALLRFRRLLSAGQ